ncbi:MAG TPA: bifunctional DNA primase/polymerase [Terriglobales bacterium]|nr:bifunctional DNA primase/polymerase [Candidatus Bathyarchaeia archaeon]HUL17038.1 bifunctional DNA primase/polymerase [Terriglobales bacterium]
MVTTSRSQARPPAQEKSRLHHTLRPASRGWRVFPLRWCEQGRCSCGNTDSTSPGKHPLTTHGVKDATLDAAQIRAWWDENPHANIGIATGDGLYVLDVDERHGGWDSLQRLEETNGPLPFWPVVRTGGGGWHFYMESREVLRNHVGIAPGIDGRGDGGYVVAVGSEHVSGCTYEWLNGIDPDDFPMLPMPGWLADQLRRPDTRNQSSSSDSSRIPKGRRNDSLARLAGSMRHRGMSREAIEAALLEENHQRCDPPLTDSEVRNIARSIGRYAPGDPNIHSAQLRDGVRAERKLTFRTAPEISAAVGEKVDWICRPWVAAGSITEVDGKIKTAGKTTWVLAMVEAISSGEEFMAEPTAKTPVVYLSEQPPASFREALARADLLDCVELRVLFNKDTLGCSWPEIASAAVEECKRMGARLLVVDTLAPFARLYGDAENSSGDALIAMEPLHAATGQGIAVIIVRHERKSGGDVADAGRGSSAFAGAVDTIISLRRPSGAVRHTVREIQALSRFSETPTELMVELRPSEGYVALGDVDSVALAEAQEQVLTKTRSEALTLDELVDATHIPRATLQRAIEVLKKEGKLARIGRGVKREPYKFRAR